MPSSQPSPPQPSNVPSEWLAGLGITGVPPALLLAAFTHPSYRSVDPDAEPYERLEFLGDAVLNLVVADEAFHAAPSAPEGVLTEQRAALVNRETLATAFERLRLSQFLCAAPGYVPSTKDKSNVVEALFGAIFLGIGYAASMTFWYAIKGQFPSAQNMHAPTPTVAPLSPEQRAFQSLYTTLGIPLVATRNAKNALQELCQKQNLPIPTYEEVTRTGPDHRPQFRVRLVLRPFARDPAAVYKATGEGLNRKAAEIQAAERLCDQIFLPYTPQ